MSAKYVMEEVKVAGVCCPQYHRIACKDHEGNRREIGVEWKVNSCKTARCVQGPDGGAELETDMETCVTDCPVGSEYVPIEGSCCGRCSKPSQDCTTVSAHGGRVGAVQLQVPSVKVKIPQFTVDFRFLDMDSAQTVLQWRAG